MQNPPNPSNDTTPYLHTTQPGEVVRRDDVVKHLELIQGVVNRMASNSFLLKGWTITLVSALFVLADKRAELFYTAIAFVPVIGFWILDGYFLNQEKRFRKLYDHVRVCTQAELQALTPFCMDADKARHIAEAGSWKDATLSLTLKYFYGFVLAAIVVVVVGGFVYSTSRPS